MPELNHQQFFHGTTANLQPGDELKPAAKLGLEHSPHRDMYLRPEDTWRPHHVFTETQPEYAPEHTAEGNAWRWAEYSSSHTGRQPAVYEVKPSSDVHPSHMGWAVEGEGGGEHVSSSATVKRRIDIPPPVNGVPRQGQLPGAGRWDAYSDLSRHNPEPEPEPERRRPQRETLF